MASATPANNTFPEIGTLPGYDPVGHQTNVAVQVNNVQTDNTVSPPIVYGQLTPANADTITVMNVTSGTTTQTSTDQTNVNYRGAYIIVNVTTLTGTSPTLTPNIQGKGPVAIQYFTLLLASAAISAAGKYIYLIYPNAAAGAGGVTQSAGFPLPHTWNVIMTVGGTVTAEAYTVEVSYIL